MRFLSRLLLAFLCLFTISSPLTAKDDAWEQHSVWYQPKPGSSLDEAAGTLTNLARFFVTFGGAQVETIAVSREGIAVASTFTTVQQNSQWVPSYGGSWIGGRYVPYYGGTTVTSRTPVTGHSQTWIGFAELAGINLSYLPNKTNKWSVNFPSKQGVTLALRTTEPALARQFADAVATLAFEYDPAVLAFSKIGFSSKAPDAKDVKRLKLAKKSGVLIVQVALGSPAETGGLLKDDVVFEMNGIPVVIEADYRRIVSEAMRDKAEAEFLFKVYRAGQPIEKRVVGKNMQIFYLQEKQARSAAGVASSAKLGIRPREATADEAKGAGLAEPRGVVVSQVLENSLAAKMDIRPGDYLLELNGAPIANVAGLVKMVSVDPVRSVKAWRNGVLIDLRPAAAPQRLGVSVRDLAANDPARQDGAGVQVTSVEANSAGAALDIRTGDLLVEANGKPIASTAALVALLGEGPVTSVKVLRAGTLLVLRAAVSL